VPPATVAVLGIVAWDAIVPSTTGVEVAASPFPSPPYDEEVCFNVKAVVPQALVVSSRNAR
jgi:hypothetical protein